jgi:hypothetical protein
MWEIIILRKMHGLLATKYGEWRIRINQRFEN